MPPIPGKHVYYLALQPSPEAAQAALSRLAELATANGLTTKPVAAERLHVSLHHLGAFKRPPGPVMDKAIDVARRVAARPFTVALDRLGSWGRGEGARQIVLWGQDGVVGVNALHADIHQQLVRAGMASRRAPPIEPHMTLVYDGAETPEIFVEPVKWRVEEFVLVHAIHGEGRWQVVERFPLRA